MAESKELLWQIIKPYWANEPMIMVVSRSSLDHWRPRIKALDAFTWGEIEEDLDIYLEMSELSGFSGQVDYRKFIDSPAEDQVIDWDLEDDEREEQTSEIYSNLDMPDPSLDFESTEFGPYRDGDWPPMPGALMFDDLPTEVAESFGEIMETIFNGTYLNIPASEKDDLFAVLEELGFVLVHEPELDVIAYARR
jgi:hypothetical protein